MSTAEAEVNPDGSTTFTSGSTPGGGDAGGESAYTEEEETFTNSTFADGAEAEVDKPTDPAIYLGLGVVVIGVLFMLYQLYQSRKKKQYAELQFFSEMDGDKFDLKLPDAVDEYYAIKDKCVEQGWEAGKVRGRSIIQGRLPAVHHEAS
jgi:hypothetical protein